MGLIELWNLQEIDLAIIGVKQKIEQAPWLSGVPGLMEEVEVLETEIAERSSRLKSDRKALKDLELRTMKILDDRRELNESMYGGKIGNVKELEQMQRRMDQLAAEKRKLEDQTINLMESIENQEIALDDCEARLAGKKEELRSGEKALRKEVAGCESELLALSSKRVALAETIEGKLLDRYTLLAGKTQGRALARVNGDLCGGCRVFISSALRGHLYNPSAMVYCENCGRLLVKLDEGVK